MHAKLEILKKYGVIPAVTINDAVNAVPLARALQLGGLPLVEVLFRSEAAATAIDKITVACKGVLVGAGTIRTVEQAKDAIAAGAKFLVSADLNPDVLEYCSTHDIAFIPGASTPSEVVQAARNNRHNVVKLFPAEPMCGVDYINAIGGPLPEVTFIPTGGVNTSNMEGYLRSPRVHAVAGTWVAPEALIEAGEFGRITNLAEQAVTLSHGFEFIHMGINAPGEKDAAVAAKQFGQLFRFPVNDGFNSLFAGLKFEFMKGGGRGIHGHIGLGTNNVERAIAYFADLNISIIPETVKQKNGRIVFTYLELEIAGFALHLMQK